MSNNNQNQWDEFDEFDSDEDDMQEKNLANDLVKQLRKADRAKEKRIKEMEAELNAYRSEKRSQTISQVLETEGVPTKIAKFIPSDVTDPEAVKAWLNENADIFGVARPQQEPPVDEAAMRRMDNVATGALSPTQIDDVYSLLEQAESPEEIAALVARFAE